MKTEKLSLKGIKNVLNRAELKKIMAGSGGPCNTCGPGGYNCCGCYNSHPPHPPYPLIAAPCPYESCQTYCASIGYEGGDQLNCLSSQCTGV